MITDTRYVSATETAKLIRRRLRALWPDVKFSVRTDKYAGGASVDVKWTDGPTADDVDEILRPYAGAGFDGMIDMQYHRAAWLHADGRVTFAETSGTEGSRGSVPSHYAAPDDLSAQLVQFGAHYVSGTRTVSPELVDAARPFVSVHCGRLDLGAGNGRYYYCSGCGDTLEGVVGLVTSVDGSWPGRAYCGAEECGAKLLARLGIVRPRNARRAV